MAIVFLSRSAYYKKVMANIENEGVAVMTGASVSLIFGFLMVLVHNFWAWEPYVIITIVSWLIVIKSVFWLAVPERMAHLSKKLYSGKAFYAIAIFFAVLGILILSYASVYIDILG
jgi:hypothetical protein